LHPCLHLRIRLAQFEEGKKGVVSALLIHRAAADDGVEDARFHDGFRS
jgi:hypothetical protein